MSSVRPADPDLRPSVDVRRASDRFVTRTDWLDSRHSFSFGPHYDPANTHFGLLVVSNHDVVAPGAGFGTHAHRDMEIVTWVLEGSLLHQDSAGHRGVIRPGLAQRMSAGAGIRHSERNDSWRVTGAEPHEEPVRFVQMWVVPDESGLEPEYEQRDIGDVLDAGGLVTVASGMPRHRDDAATRVNQSAAALHAARVQPGGCVSLPGAPFVHLYVARGAVDLEGVGELREGDAARLTATDGRRVSAGEQSEVLAWEMHSQLAGP